MVLQEMLISLPVRTLLNIPPHPAHTISSAMLGREFVGQTQRLWKGCILF